MFLPQRVNLQRSMQIAGQDEVTVPRAEFSAQPPVLITSHAWYHEQIGGSFKIATELAEYLAGRGRRVFYVCSTRERVPVNPTIEHGVELWRYPLPRAASLHPANVLYHVLGYLKKALDAFEKREAVQLIEDYRTGLVPLVVPITLLRHHAAKHRVGYLAGQIYLEPHPKELMLRNRV